MNKLDKAKEIIKKYYDDANYGIFDRKNTVGDIMSTVYDDGDLRIDICFAWFYFEVFDLG